MPLLLWCRTVCGQRGWLLVTKSVCINWILFFKVWLICLGLLSSGDHFVGCQPQIPAQEWLRSLAWLIKGFWHQSLTLPCQCHYKQLLIIPCPGHGQRRGGQVPNGRSFCIPSNEGAVGQFGPGAKAMSCRSSLSFALNARFESKLCVNLMPVLKSKLLVILRAFTHCKNPLSVLWTAVQFKSKLSWALRTGTRTTTGGGSTSVARIGASSRRSFNTAVWRTLGKSL